MAKLDALTPAPSTEVEAQRLSQICSLLESVGAGPYRAVPQELAAPVGSHRMMPGWALAGGESDEQRRAAADLVRCLYRAEEEIRSLSAEINERYEEAALIYQLSQRLGRVLGEEAIAKLVLDRASDLLGAASGEIWLRCDGHATLAARTGDATRVLGSPAEEAARISFEQARPWTREDGTGSQAVVAVPLPGSSKQPIGVLALRGRTHGRSYRSGEVKLLQSLAALTSAFIRNDRLAHAARIADARKQQDRIARAIHQSLLPSRDPDIAGLELAGSCRVAENIGGDYYGYIRLRDGSTLVCIADASGHGVGAGLYMAMAKGVLQAEAGWVESPTELMRRTNRSLVEEFEQSGMFTTACVARILPGGRRIEYCDAGHNPPALLRTDGTAAMLNRGGPALGLLGGSTYEEGHCALTPDDVLLIYTDGLTEARDLQRRFYTTERMIRVAGEHRAGGARQIRDGLLEDLERHRQRQPTHDDVTLVVIRAIEAEGAAGRQRA